jgi:hypothetical protein
MFPSSILSVTLIPSIILIPFCNITTHSEVLGDVDSFGGTLFCLPHHIYQYFLFMVSLFGIFFKKSMPLLGIEGVGGRGRGRVDGKGGDGGRGEK